MDKNIVINNQKDLEYFRKLQNSQLPVSRHSVEKWDQRAENWEKEYRGGMDVHPSRPARKKKNLA